MSGPPGWVADAIFYQVFPDRFARSPSVAKPPRLQPWEAPPTHFGFKGGDLVGIAEHLDWIETQRTMIADIGIQRYLQSQIGD